jgi:hypothetical protein
MLENIFLNYKLEEIWKETFGVYFVVLLQHWPWATKENHVPSVSPRAEFRKLDLSNDHARVLPLDRDVCFDAIESIGRSVELLLAFAITIILSFRSRRDLWPRFLFSPRHVHVYKWGLLFDGGRGRSFCVGATFVAPQFQHEYILSVTPAADKLLLALASTVILGSESHGTPLTLTASLNNEHKLILHASSVH